VVVAEESTAFPGVTSPTKTGGLGFDLKWNMGWMHDSLAFLEKDPLYRKFNHNRLTFALYYAFHEKYLLPLSHDEVVHLKKSLLDKMPGDGWQKHANLRLLHAWQAAHPGKSLLFMGGEIGQWKEWNHDAELEWSVLGDGKHRGLSLLVGDLNRLVKDRKAMHECAHDWTGFQWIDFSDVDQSVISFVRWSREKEEGVLWAFNFTPEIRKGYRIGAPRPGRYDEILNTDAACYGGSGLGNMGGMSATDEEKHGQPHSLILTLPPLAAVAFAVPRSPLPSEPGA
jgi:1,4-alpha-glucan branching enzyme